MSARSPCAQELCGRPNVRTGTSTSRSRSSLATASPKPPTRPLSSTVTTRGAARPRGQRRVDRLDPARVDHGDADALAGQPLGDVRRSRRGHRRRRRRAARRPRPPARPARRSTSMPPSLPTAGDRPGRRRALGKRSAVGPSATATASRSSSRSLVPSRGHRDPHAGHELQDRQVPHAVVAGAVRAGDPGPVEHEGDRQPVQRHVHQHLVEGPVEERRVDRDDRVQAAHGQPGRAGDRVLLGDADVEDPVREALGERRSPAGCSIAAVIATTSARSCADLDQLLGEDLGPAVAAAGSARAGSPVLPSVHSRAGRTWCRQSSSFSLGRRVTAALPGDARARSPGRRSRGPRRSACSTACSSCPSIGPRYFRPRSSNSTCGCRKSFRPFLIPCSVS